MRDQQAILDLRAMVKGAYDLQMLRMQAGLRLCANFRAKLGLEQGKKDDAEDEEDAEALDIIKKLKESYRRLTDGIAKNRTLPPPDKFIGDEIISSYSEAILVDQYVGIEKQEAKQFRQLEFQLEQIAIYREYLSNVVGIGPAMAGVLIASLDPYKARHVSSFWKYTGLDVATDGAGRSRRQEHLIEREYINKDGKTAMRMSVTYNPWLKTKLVGVLASSFLRSGSSWRSCFDDYKNRINSDPARIKITVGEWKKLNKDGGDMRGYWTPGRIKNAASRYMVKMFLADFWVRWRKLEGLPVTEPYAVAKLGHSPHGYPKAAE